MLGKISRSGVKVIARFVKDRIASQKKNNKTSRPEYSTPPPNNNQMVAQYLSNSRLAHKTDWWLLWVLWPIQYYMSRDMTKPTKWLCAKQRLRSAWASAQSDQSLRCALNGYLRTQASFMRTVKRLYRVWSITYWHCSWEVLRAVKLLYGQVSMTDMWPGSRGSNSRPWMEVR